MRKAVKMHSRSRVQKNLDAKRKGSQDADEGVVDAPPACAPSLAQEVSASEKN